MVSFQFSVFSGQFSVSSGQWSVVSGQWAVFSGQWSVVSFQWSVVSGQWSVGSGWRIMENCLGLKFHNELDNNLSIEIAPIQNLPVFFLKFKFFCSSMLENVT